MKWRGRMTILLLVDRTLTKELLKVMVDNGTVMNVMPTSTMAKLNCTDEDLVKMGVTITDFKGAVTSARGILWADIKVGSRVITLAFFVVDVLTSYSALLGQNWIHVAKCIPSSLHQKLILWTGRASEVVLTEPRPFAINSLVSRENCQIGSALDVFQS
ncbi:hypothetical protein CRG98_040354 [Punica granatum]|uniref:Aspartic peptidase DDI1-type domain-containing protein n=1 Tax=Punica granatum TaxID=22663 RepID=A0A2I0I5N8_PUNGR|nr:hypothetical protein CRG98_040354 [Punica granatum]